MVADDQPLIAASLGQFLAVHCACRTTLLTTDMAQLLAAAEQDPPQLILIDACMAKAFRTVRTLSTHQPQIKIVLIDELRIEMNLRRAIDCGVSGYCTKCDPAAEILALIRKVLAGGVVLPQPAVPGTKLEIARPHTDGVQSLSLLTRREVEVLVRLAEGFRVAECAHLLGISPNTVENHKAHIMRKLGLHKNVELARFAIRHGLTTDE